MVAQTVPEPWYASSESAEWYTAPAVIERVLRVFGEIDLDPCSNPAPHNVPARQHFTRAEDGLARWWHGRVYVNPPYGRALLAWMEKLANEIAAGRVTEAITLTPARPDTRWFRTLWGADALCFWRGRLRFVNSTAVPFPSVIGYFGRNIEAFIAAFGDAGEIAHAIQTPSLMSLRRRRR